MLVKQATAIREACNKVLVRRKETTDRETISRITNEVQRREEAKLIIERQLEEDQKAMKQVERERRKRDEKDAAKNARQVEKKKRSRAVTSTTSNTQRSDNKIDEHQQLESIEADDERLSSDVKETTLQEECFESSFSNCSPVNEGTYE